MKRLLPILLVLLLAFAGRAATSTIPTLTSHSPVVASNLFLVETGASTNGAYKLTFSNLQIGVLTSMVAGANITLARTNNVLTISASGGGAGSLPTNNTLQLTYHSADGKLSIVPGAVITNLAGRGAATNMGTWTLEAAAQQMYFKDVGGVSNLTITANGTQIQFFGTNISGSATLRLIASNNAVLPGADGGILGAPDPHGTGPYRWKGDFTNSAGHFTTLLGTTAKVLNSLTMSGGAVLQMSNGPVLFGANAPVNGGYIQNANGALGGGNTNALAFVAGDVCTAVLVLSNATFAPAYGVGADIWLGTNSAPWAGLALDATKLAGTGPYLGLSNNTVILTNIGAIIDGVASNSAATTVPFRVTAVANTTTNLQEWGTNGVVLVNIRSNGTLVGTNAIFTGQVIFSNATSSGAGVIIGNSGDANSIYSAGSGDLRLKLGSANPSYVINNLSFALVSSGAAFTWNGNEKVMRGAVGDVAIQTNLVVVGSAKATNGFIAATNAALAATGTTNYFVNVAGVANVLVTNTPSATSTIWLTNLVAGKTLELTVVGAVGAAYQIMVTNVANDTFHNVLWDSTNHPPVSTNTDIWLFRFRSTNAYGRAFLTNAPNRAP
jgi:hypothetical protein